MSIGWMGAEELAAVVCGLDEDNYDSGQVEDALYEKFDCSFETFHKIAEALVPLTIPATAALSGQSFRGFVKNGSFIVKEDA